MHRVTKPIVLGVAALFGVGLISAAAANHGEAVSTVAKAKAMVGEARGDQVSALAKTNGDIQSDKAKADAKADKAARNTAKATREAERDADKAAKGDRDDHGTAVSIVARSDATAAHSTGAKKVNHGGAVRVAAHAGK
jgi:hypothetical protein